MTRLSITKTYKLFIAGKFPRSESGRSRPVTTADGAVLAHVCDASRKDLRDAVSAARAALAGWRDATAYNRGQILYRLAEMLESRRAEFAEILAAFARRPGVREPRRGTPSNSQRAAQPTPAPIELTPRDEVSRSIDRLVHYAGWADKYAQVLGSSNSVAGPYHNFTIPEPTGVVAIVAPSGPGAPPLLGLMTLLAPALCPGNACVLIAGESGAAQLAAVLLAEAIATSDVPPGVVNILTGSRAELIPAAASHRDIDAVLATSGPGGVSPEHEGLLRAGVGDNLKRVTVRTPSFLDDTASQGPLWIEPVVEFKTIWHPSAT